MKKRNYATRLKTIPQRYAQIYALSLGLALATPLVTPLTVWAQTTSAISGTVADGSGATVPGAVITATNTGTGIQFHAITDASGTYRITQLPPGSYTMEIISQGFETQNLTPFPLLVAQQSQQNITLAVGKETQTVSVSAASLLIETDNST